MASSSQSQECGSDRSGEVGFRLGHQLPGALQLPVEHGGPDATPAPFGVDAAEEIGAVLALGARPVPDLGPCDHSALAIDGKAESDSGSKKGASYSETTSSNGVTSGSLSLTSLRRITPWTSGRSSGVMGRSSMPSGDLHEPGEANGPRTCPFLHFGSDVVRIERASSSRRPFL